MKSKRIVITIVGILFSIGAFVNVGLLGDSKSVSLNLNLLHKAAFANGEGVIDDCESIESMATLEYENGLLAYEHYDYHCEGQSGFCEAGTYSIAYSYDEDLQLIYPLDVTDTRELDYC